MSRALKLWITTWLLGFAAFCTWAVADETRHPLRRAEIRTGPCGWYGEADRGKVTADGSLFDERLCTVALATRRDLGSVVLIRHHGRTVAAVCNDVMSPLSQARGWVVELSHASWRRLAPLTPGPDGRAPLVTVEIYAPR